MAIAPVDIVSEMLRHIVLLTLTAAAGEEELTAIEEGLGALPSVIPELQAYSVHRDIGISAGNATIAIVGDFPDEAAYRTYAEDPTHLQVIADKIKPFVQARSAVQINIA